MDIKSSARVDGATLTHDQFMEYVKAFTSLFKNEIDTLERFDRDGNLLSIPFCICYERLLEDRLCYCITCSEYYRAMAEKSFWFMKRFVIRRAMKFEITYNQTLGRLMQVKLYRKLQYGEGKGFTD